MLEDYSGCREASYSQDALLDRSVLGNNNQRHRKGVEVFPATSNRLLIPAHLLGLQPKASSPSLPPSLSLSLSLSFVVPLW